MKCVLLAAAALLLTACYPRGFQAPVPYTVQADGGVESIECARDRLIELDFQFPGDQGEAEDLVGTRSSRRTPSQLSGSTRDIAHEVVRLQLKNEGEREVFEMTVGIARRPDPSAPLSDDDRADDLWLEAPARSSIREVDEIAVDCQRSPFG